MPGRHNVLNALVAVAIAHQLEIDDYAVRDGLASFGGVGRRFDVLGDFTFDQSSGAKVLLVDDYAHHPKELAATLVAANDCWPDRRIVALFQPHRYSRTQSLFDDFAQVLSSADPLLLLEVYPAGEQAISTADGRSLAAAIRARGGEVTFVDGFDEASQVLAHQLRDGDVLLTLGAGDIGRYAKAIADSGQLDFEQEVG